ncbi:hypothetical protein PIB30_030597 [Stylosanthes scabra]|uniref:Uncharacterized protein n=1 Tax=Stylosanthes scabra TaxID=79078 RepID=A0ABU6VCF7_9FABA|nr:hypothetical protein [Stylosanthes scabra]
MLFAQELSASTSFHFAGNISEYTFAVSLAFRLAVRCVIRQTALRWIGCGMRCRLTVRHPSERAPTHNCASSSSGSSGCFWFLSDWAMLHNSKCLSSLSFAETTGKKVAAEVEGTEMAIQFIIEEPITTIKELIIVTTNQILVKWEANKNFTNWQLNFERNKLVKLIKSLGLWTLNM